MMARMPRTVFEAELDAKGLTQADVKRKVGLSRAMVSLLVAGHRRPSLGAAERIAKMLGRPIDGLFKLAPKRKEGETGGATEPGAQADAPAR